MLITINDIADKLNITGNKARDQVNRLGIKPVKKVNHTFYYNADALEKVDNKINPKCPICGGRMNNLCYGEAWCRNCNKFFKSGREIEYTAGGVVVPVRNKKESVRKN